MHDPNTTKWTFCQRATVGKLHRHYFYSKWSPGALTTTLSLDLKKKKKKYSRCVGISVMRCHLVLSLTWIHEATVAPLIKEHETLAL